MQTVAIVQARLSSTRLPRKAAVDICGKSLLQRVVDRVRLASTVRKIVVAVPSEEPDTLDYVELGRNVKGFLGSRDDVLDRFYHCAKAHDADPIVRITADDPFKDPDVIDRIVRTLTKTHADYVSTDDSFPVGMVVEAFTFQTLEMAWCNAESEYEKEHVTPYIYKHEDIFDVRWVKNDRNEGHIRLTVDTSEDLERARELYARLPEGFRTREIRGGVG